MSKQWEIAKVLWMRDTGRCGEKGRSIYKVAVGNPPVNYELYYDRSCRKLDHCQGLYAMRKECPQALGQVLRAIGKNGKPYRETFACQITHYPTGHG